MRWPRVLLYRMWEGDTLNQGHWQVLTRSKSLLRQKLALSQCRGSPTWYVSTHASLFFGGAVPLRGQLSSRHAQLTPAAVQEALPNM